MSPIVLVIENLALRRHLGKKNVENRFSHLTLIPEVNKYVIIPRIQKKADARSIFNVTYM